MKKNIMNYKKICALLTVSLFIGNAPINETYASSIKLYNYATKTSVSYTNKQIKYVYEGKSISLSKTPGVLSDNGVALGSYYHIFKKSLGLSCTLDKKQKKVTVSDDDTTIVMTVGSKTAYVNGKAVTMNAAPVSYKYLDANKALTLVPTRFVAETFGYQYQWDSSSSTVTITKPIELLYNNKNIAYKGIKGSVTTDGLSVNVSSLPTIILSNTEMIQAWKVFAQALNVNYKYDLTTGELSFTKDNISVDMMLNSKTAYINGEAVESSAPPLLITNLENNKQMVLVPGQFLAEALGYSYHWNITTNTSEIVSTDYVGKKSKVTPTPSPTNTLPEPTKKLEEPSDNSASIGEVQATYFTWNVNNDFQSEIESAKNANENTTKEQLLTTDYIATTYLSSIYQNTENSNTMKETFQILLESPISSVTTKKEENRITLTFQNTICSESKYNTLDSKLVTDISSGYDISSTSSIVTFQLADDSYDYDIQMSEDGKAIDLNVYPNYIESVTSGNYSDGSDYFQINGIDKLDYELTEDDYYIYLNITNAANTYGENKYYSSDISHINYVLLESPTKQSSSFIIQKPYVGATYKITNTNNFLNMKFINSDNTNDTEEESTDFVEFELPDGVGREDISDIDEYYNKQIVINIDGNYLEYFQSNPIRENHDMVTGINVTYSNNKTQIKIKTKKIQGYFLEYGTNKLKINIANPSEIYKKIVVLDAGHGGVDPGTLKGKVYEKDIVFNILNNYTKDYFENSDIKVYYSRVNDTKIDLHKRADFSDEVEADFFVSLHVNASSSSSVKGTSVYYSTRNNLTASNGLSSLKLASALVKNLTSSLGTKNLGVKTANFVVIGENTVPSVLIELAFITNSSDYKLLIDKTFQRKAAKSIYNTIEDLFDKYPTKR